MISERVLARSFEAFWQELLPLLTPRYIALFNEAYRTTLADSEGPFENLSIPAGIERTDVIAEFAFRLARLAYQEKISFDIAAGQVRLINKAETEALAIIRRYEGGKSTKNSPMSSEEKSEGVRISRRYASLFNSFPEGAFIEFCPRIPGAGFLDSCEGDVSIGQCLVEVKTTTRKPSGRDLRQLIVYSALDANSGMRRWKEFGIFNPRRGTLHKVEVDSFVLHVSGGKPSLDIFADLIVFLESNEPVVERKF